jgi:cystathionine gamma-synthase/cystathionine gamma-lyase
MEFETRAIHAGQKPDPATGSVIVPVYQTSTYQQEAVGVHKGFEYSRTGNPTRSALEEALASLESAKFGLAFASGLAASTAVLSLLSQGDHIVAGNDLYGGTFRLLERVFKRYGIQITYADVDDVQSFADSIKPATKMLWIETPTNPLLKIIDIQQLAQIAHRRNCLLAVDNTFATPFFQRPLELGADIVVHSTTKYIAGHSDIVGGAVLTSNDDVYSQVKYYQNAAGAIPGPWDCWLALRGIKTLAIRMKQHSENALQLAQFLQDHPAVQRVFYPGLESHPNYQLAKKQMAGYSGMVSFEINGDFTAVENFLSKLKIITLAESLGGVESLVCYPPRMTHAFLSEQQRHARGINDNLVRLSIGIENVNDLKQDLQTALN